MMNKKSTLQKKPIGVFDSGMGGISVLKNLVSILPQENFIFYGDSANAPYGVKTVEEVKNLSRKNVKHLLNEGAKMIVVACNTATSAAINDLRKENPDVPFIGLEPAVKPAVEHKPNSKVGVMATPLTLKQKKFKELKSKYSNEATIEPIPAPNLVEFVEKGDVNSKELKTYLSNLLSDYTNVDSIVLGCTHFPFAINAIRKVMGEDVFIIDGGPGAAREARNILEQNDLLNPQNERGWIKFENSTGEYEKIDLSHKLFKMNLE
ncbi:glutamate racemase [Ligilactobacillus hayakitensis]